jgi:hypothetical protein
LVLAAEEAADALKADGVAGLGNEAEAGADGTLTPLPEKGNEMGWAAWAVAKSPAATSEVAKYMVRKSGDIKNSDED